MLLLERETKTYKMILIILVYVINLVIVISVDKVLILASLLRPVPRNIPKKSERDSIYDIVREEYMIDEINNNNFLDLINNN